MRAENRFVGLLDWFVARHYADNINLLYRARLLVGTLLVLSGVLFAFMLYMAYGAPLGASGRVAAVQFIAPLLLMYALLLVAVRVIGGLNFCSHALLFASIVVLMVAVFYSGGPAVSPARPMLMVLVVMAYCLTGLVGGLFWTASMLLVQAVFFYLMLNDYHFPYLGEAASDGYNVAFNWLLAVFNCSAVMVVYERINHRLSEQLEGEKESFAHQAHHDALTGLHNRARFDDELERALLRAERSGDRVGLMYMDLDGFKPINDTLGHEAGDAVLRAVADRLKARLRRADAIARLGGDEFAIIVEQLDDPSVLGKIASSVLACVREPVTSLPGQPHVTASLGIAVYPDHAGNATELLRRADQAMYQAKHEHGVWTMASTDA